MDNVFIKVTRLDYFGWIAIIISRDVGFINAILCEVIDDLNAKNNKLQLYLYENEYEVITNEGEINKLNKLMVFK